MLPSMLRACCDGAAQVRGLRRLRSEKVEFIQVKVCCQLETAQGVSAAEMIGEDVGNCHNYKCVCGLI